MDPLPLSSRLPAVVQQTPFRVVPGEFFYVSPSDVRRVLEEVRGSLMTFNEVPEAIEWRQSEHVRRGVGAT
jgi:hypothetical protein